ncbi:MAG: hypothetical protein RL685_4544, partial [Pseudomonadota bacterium]
MSGAMGDRALRLWPKRWLTALLLRPLLLRAPQYRARLCGALAALVSVASAWGFSVDDALISARVAEHLSQGHGYRFNLDGPSTDCVTPLGWAHLLAPFARGGAEAALSAAALLGSALWLLAAGQLGHWAAELCTGARRWAFFACIAGSLPLGAWACAGMETGLVLALGVGALAPGLPGAVCAGMAAALRPELVPWAVTLSFGQALAARAPVRARAAALAAALLPALLVALLRWSLFGLPVPLSVYAKPSDFAHGLRYVFGTLVLAGPALGLLSVVAWRRIPARLWAVTLAFAVHVLILLGVGGDWMPLWRLAVPTFPGVLLVGAALAEHSPHWSNLLRALLLTAAAAQLHYFLGSDTRAVRARQSRIIAEARLLLAGSRRIGAVDVGWLGAVSDQHLVDFAGVTDPQVAFLPGGHTSKRLPRDFLERQRIDTL